MRVGSIFSGIGGIELGLERAGFETVWFVEKDKYCQAVLRKHWPSATIYDDVTAIDPGSVPAIDVLAGGFPCQDISNAGKRTGIQGSRSGLWKEFLRLISGLRPRYVIAENVAALTQRGLDTVLCDLAALGYDAEWYCIPASSVGAPHRRDRIFILAYTNNSGCVHRQACQLSDCGGGRHSMTLGKAVKMWPTPRANDAEKRGQFNLLDPRNGLPAAARMFPTPVARMYRDCGAPSEMKRDSPSVAAIVIHEEGGGQLNPTWVEWLMGFPPGWTELDASVTQSFRKSRKRLEKQ